jgi:hypothetical protein
VTLEVWGTGNLKEGGYAVRSKVAGAEATGCGGVDDAIAPDDCKIIAAALKVAQKVMPAALVISEMRQGAQDVQSGAARAVLAHPAAAAVEFLPPRNERLNQNALAFAASRRGLCASGRARGISPLEVYTKSLYR